MASVAAFSCLASETRCDPLTYRHTTLSSRRGFAACKVKTLHCDPVRRHGAAVLSSKLGTRGAVLGNSVGKVATQASRVRRTRAFRSVCASTASPDDAVGELEESTLTVPSGYRLEVLSQKPSSRSSSRRSSKPPLVFIHGSYHAAWCWAVHFMPFFAGLGYEVHALSLRGQGRGDKVEVLPTTDDHAADIIYFLNKLRAPAVLVGHSFGGIIVQRIIGGGRGGGIKTPKLAGAVLACSVPPYGNGPMVARFLMAKPLASLRLTWSLAAGGWDGNPKLCRESFFSSDLPEPTLTKYMQLMRANSRGRLLDLKHLNGILPLAVPPKGSIPVLVMGAAADFCVDVKGVEDTAEAYGVRAHVLNAHIPHDIMLDVKWPAAADVIHGWLTDNTRT